MGTSAGSPTPFAPYGPDGSGVLDEEALDRGRVADRRDQVVVEVVRPPGHVLLHERHAEALDDPALDLPLDERRVDRPPHVVGRDDPADDDGPELGVDVHERDLRPEPVRLVRDALARRRRGRSSSGRTSPVSSRTQPRAPTGSSPQLDDRDRRPVAHPQPPVAATGLRDLDHRVLGPPPRARGSAVGASSPASRVAFPETKVWREADVLPASGVRSVSGALRHERADADAQRIRRDLRDDGCRPLPDVHRAREQPHGPVRPDAEVHGRRVGERGVADAVPHRPDADAASDRRARRLRSRARRLRVREQRRPVRGERVEAGG